MRSRALLALLVLVGALGAGVVVWRGEAAPDRATPGAVPAGPAPASPPASAPSRGGVDADTLRRRLVRVLERPGLAPPGREVSVIVRDRAGRTVLARGADVPRLPASTAKLVTAAAALMTLGPEHRFATTLDTAGRVTGSTLRGDLVVTGGADPVLATPAYARHVAPDRPHTPLARLAGRLARRGITTVAGDLVADPSILAGRALADDWKPKYLKERDARPVGGLVVDAGLLVDRESPVAGRQAVVGLAVDPAERVAVVLRDLLAERGVTVRGTVRVADRPVRAPRRLAAVASPRLRTLLRHMVQESDNHLADTLLRAVGRALGGDGSWESAGAVARSLLDHLGIDATGARLRDGSGLSRGDRLTVRQLIDLHAVMQDSRFGSLWTRLLAVAGRSGTLERRLVDTPAAGALRGKTGSLEDLTALVGSVRGPDGAQHDLAVLVRHPEDRKHVASTLVDELVLAVAEAQRGCTRRPRPDAQPADGARPHVPPYRLRCPPDPSS